ncbi:GGDEF domain-containing protein [Salimicrobium halophilum]|uniref:GGDEF domain-containing protein n=1 Tax=Salimicrobium halophilum TaxID=86666 RepID=UPI001FDF5D73|nr:GGDEF domain-containing protein [Salimicrobium halophilum]
MDLRQIPLAIVAFYGGPFPAGLAGALIIAGRFLLGVNESAILAGVMVAIMTIAVIALARLPVRRTNRLLLMVTATNFIFSGFAFYLLKDDAVLTIVLFAYWIASYIGIFTAYYLVEYERKHQRLLNRYKDEASTDSLTGLNNTRKFDELFNEISIEAMKKDESLTLLYVDIDHFKQVNDTYGHPEGDEILAELGKLLRENVRSFDVVSRNGGEEFSVLLLDASLEKSRYIGERVRKNVQLHPFLLTTGKYIHITVSIGLAHYKATTAEPEHLLKNADKALYKAKRSGRNKLCTYEPEQSGSRSG